MIGRHLSTDADVAAGRSFGAVLARELRRCVLDMSRAANRGRGRTRLVAPYWMFRRFLGLLLAPLDDSRLLFLTFSVAGAPVTIAVRRNQADLYVLREIFLEHMYELNLPPAAQRVRTLVDLGANAGLSTAYLSARYAPEVALAVEPIPDNVRVIVANAAISDQRWRVEPAAAASTPGQLSFYVSGIWSSCTAVPRVGETRHAARNRLEPVLERPSIVVEATSVPDLMRRHGLDHIDLLKIDIEGGEEDLLLHRADWLAHVDNVVIEIHDKYIDGTAIRRALSRQGFGSRPQPGPCELWVRDSDQPVVGSHA